MKLTYDGLMKRYDLLEKKIVKLEKALMLEREHFAQIVEELIEGEKT